MDADSLADETDDVTRGESEKKDATKSTSVLEDKDADVTEKSLEPAEEPAEGDDEGDRSKQDVIPAPQAKASAPPEKEDTRQAEVTSERHIASQFVTHFNLVAVDSEAESSDEEDEPAAVRGDRDEFGWGGVDVMNESPRQRSGAVELVTASANTSGASEGGRGEAVSNVEDENFANQWWWCNIL